jgi:DNA-binding CsgD family transcriptional regulator
MAAGFGGATSPVGRDDELATIAELLEQVRHGRSGALVVRGEAGIGKTCLLGAAVMSSNLEAFRVVGIESEMRLAFAALHQLLAPFLPEIESLPPPQARALKAAFGISDDATPDPFLVGLAALTLITTAAATSEPFLIVVDDAQWLDQESAEAIAFIARRLFADRVGLLVGMRDPSESQPAFDGLGELHLDPLSDAAAAGLLDAAVGAPLADHVRDRLLADACGNPLALLVFGRELSSDQVAGVAQIPEPIAVDRRLEHTFLHQISGLPAATQRLLLLAAAEPTGDIALILRAGRDLGITDDAMTPAQNAGLVELGTSLTFRHPLIRSAVYQGASHGARREAHQALASACSAERDKDRRAWHLGAATYLPNDDVASELEDAARRAASRGGCAASAAFSSRAAQLTTDERQRAIRFLAAASSDLAAGSTLRAQQNLEHALPDLHEPLLRAHARRLEAAIAFMDAFPGTRPSTTPGRGAEIVSMMLDAVRVMEAVDVALARDAMHDTISMTIYFGGSNDMSTVEIAQMARAMQLAAGTKPTAADLVFDATAEIIANGYGDAGPLLRSALAAVQVDANHRTNPRLLARACWIAFALGNDDALLALAKECAVVGRDQGAFQILPEAVGYQAIHALRTGLLDEADELFTEVNEMHVLMHRQSGPSEATQLIVWAWRGRESEVRAGAERLATEAPQLDLVMGYTQHAVMLLELGLGNYNAAAAAARERWTEDISLSALRAADSVEAHARSGDDVAARRAMSHLAARAETSRSALDLGLMARSQALVADDEDAEAFYSDAITRLGARGARLHLARAQLLYGEWLRRRKRRRDARRQLESAYDTLKSLGAYGFAERARVEILATGAQARKRVDETRNDLTPQERQIARLAAEGATNPEIAERLFISASTVDYHLRKVYRKLDIQSRHQLAHAVAAE